MINLIERLLIRNISGIIFLIILFIIEIYLLQFFHLINNVITLDFTITSVGAILVFWYGYKKYERDKELNIIEKYTEKYEKIKIIENIEERYIKLFDLFYEEFYLYNSLYINKNLWNTWLGWIKIDFIEMYEYEEINNTNIFEKLVENHVKYHYNHYINSHENDFISLLFDLNTSISNDFLNKINKINSKLAENQVKLAFQLIKKFLFKSKKPFESPFEDDYIFQDEMKVLNKKMNFMNLKLDKIITLLEKYKKKKLTFFTKMSIIISNKIIRYYDKKIKNN